MGWIAVSVVASTSLAVWGCWDDDDTIDGDPKQFYNQIYWYHLDHLGTPLWMTDVAGNIVWRGLYDPYGQAYNDNSGPRGGAHVVNWHRFPGQYAITAHRIVGGDLHYNHHRYYHPGIGRYITPDPLGMKSDSNLYNYVWQSPISHADPDGMEGDTSQPDATHPAVHQPQKPGFWEDAAEHWYWNPRNKDVWDDGLDAPWKYPWRDRTKPKKPPKLKPCPDLPQPGKGKGPKKDGMYASEDECAERRNKHRKQREDDLEYRKSVCWNYCRQNVELVDEREQCRRECRQRNGLSQE